MTTGKTIHNIKDENNQQHAMGDINALLYSVPLFAKQQVGNYQSRVKPQRCQSKMVAWQILALYLSIFTTYFVKFSDSHGTDTLGCPLSLKIISIPRIQPYFKEITVDPSILLFIYTFLPRCMECNAVLRWDFCPSVRPSVCPSVKRVHCDKTEESYV